MNIFIASSSSVTDNKYLLLAKEIACQIKYDYDLVCGGINSSMMNVIYNEFKNAKRNITCVTLECYNEDLTDVDDVYLLDSTMDRMKYLYEIADVLLFLPGGSGTYSEVFGMLEEARTKQDGKKIILFNVDGYYDNIINVLKNSISAGFNKESIFDYISVIDDINDLKKVKEKRIKYE